MPFVSSKKTGGWWIANEIVSGGRCEEEVVAECEIRNIRRLESKKISAQMAQKEYKQARDSYPDKATLVNYLRNQNAQQTQD